MLPKKKNGFRKIVVNSTEYYWKFPVNTRIEIRYNKTFVLTVDTGYIDYWDIIFYVASLPDPEKYLQVVTPKIVRTCILFACGQGWISQFKNIDLEYKENKFKLISTQ